MIQLFDKEKGIQHKLIELTSLSNEKSATITDLIAFGADNTNTNFGSVKRNPGENIYTKLQSALECEIAGIGCGDHIYFEQFTSSRIGNVWRRHCFDHLQNPSTFFDLRSESGVFKGIL